ncbi:MAG TPA: hypothetical protein VGC13_19645 [Longimicrobium sp.]|jgi:hypothetical protein|uniref:hypothetical protein n=1 Tax=Longimicrobium sp. TaxID=2029185 RepID=UPI002ED990DF
MEFLWAAVGALVGLVLTVFVQPFIEGAAHGVLVRTFGSARRRKQLLAGTWQQQWAVESTNFPPVNPSTVQMKQLGKRVSAKFASAGRMYFVNGEVSQGTYLTGTWYDEAEGSTYHGAFQLRIRPNNDSMVGKWVGFGESGEIKTGVWEWRRVESQTPAPTDTHA